MKLKFSTAVATLVQFILLSFLGIANALNSMVATCRHDSPNCADNILVSIVFWIFTAAWFGAIWILGVSAQERHSKRLAQLLIAVELFVGLIALFNARHHTDLLGLSTSIIDLILVVWVISSAIRLLRSSGKPGPKTKGAGRSRARRRKN